MAKETINIGDTGQDLVDKLDNNFTELYEGLLIYKWDGKSSSNNPGNIPLFQKIIDSIFKDGKTVGIAVQVQNGTMAGRPYYIQDILTLNDWSTNNSQITFHGKIVATNTSSGNLTYRTQPTATITINDRNNWEVLSVGAISLRSDNLNSSQSSLLTAFSGTVNFTTSLTTNNNTAYTPTNPYNPTTKKYVDDEIAKLKAELLGGS